MYRVGAGGASIFLLLLAAAAFGSGVALALASGARDPAFDSLFFKDSFLVRGALSRANAASSCGFAGLKSGLRGEEIAGWWSSSRTRFCGMEERGGVAVGVASRLGEFVPSVDIFEELGERSWAPRGTRVVALGRFPTFLIFIATGCRSAHRPLPVVICRGMSEVSWRYLEVLLKAFVEVQSCCRLRGGV